MKIETVIKVLIALSVIMLIILIGAKVFGDFYQAYEECVRVYGNCTIR